MTERSETTDEFEALKRRWREEPSPALALRLAEEHGRRRQFEPAVEVLRRGLEARPGHLSARVALGRYLLELERPAESASELEAVVTKDPTHLVANKLLVRAYSQLGERAKAVDRLDLYTLLNESDPELDELRRMTEEIAGPPAEVDAPEAAAAAEGESSEAATPAAGEAAEGPAAPQEAAPPPAAPAPQEVAPPPAAPVLQGAARPPAAPLAAPLPESGRESVAALSPPAAAAAAVPSDPFPELLTASDAGRYRSALAAEGIFELERPAADSEAATPRDEPWPEAHDATVGTAAGEIVDRTSGVAEEPATSPEVAGEVLEPWPGSLVAAGSAAAPAEITTPPPGDGDEVAEPRPQEDEAAPGSATGEVATAASSGELMARDLLDAGELGLAPVERKRALLGHYLTRIRSGESADV